MPQPTRRRTLVPGIAAAAALCAATTLVLTTSSDTPVVSNVITGPSTREQEYAILQTRPDADDAVATYEQFLADIRDVLTTMHHVGPWQRKPLSSPTTSCGSDFPTTDVDDAVKTTVPTWYTSAARLDPAAWPDVRAAIINAGYRFGFGRGLLETDVPDNYLLTLINGTGASAEITVDVNATLSLSTGCHLTHAARERGTPAPENTTATPSPR